MFANDKNKNSMEKELREIIGWNCGGTYEAKVKVYKDIFATVKFEVVAE
jgi:ribosomal protein L9